VAFWNNLLPKLQKQDGDDGDGSPQTLTWVFVALTTALLVVVVVLSLCVFYFRKLSYERCVVHANEFDTKNSCQL
jgi:hypothetical protein